MRNDNDVAKYTKIPKFEHDPADYPQGQFLYYRTDIGHVLIIEKYLISLTATD